MLPYLKLFQSFDEKRKTYLKKNIQNLIYFVEKSAFVASYTLFITYSTASRAFFFYIIYHVFNIYKNRSEKFQIGQHFDEKLRVFKKIIINLIYFVKKSAFGERTSILKKKWDIFQSFDEKRVRRV